ncbi:hypothetical protein CF326_g1499 [Tilletia indica]|nr:hypothetical protein CF326_g1499 [Tilletia indica]
MMARLRPEIALLSLFLFLATISSSVSVSPAATETGSDLLRAEPPSFGSDESVPQARLFTPRTESSQVHLNDILSVPDPGLALGQSLSGSSEPDPMPSTTSSSANPLTNADPPTPLPRALKQTIMNKTIMYSGAAYCPSVMAGNWTCGFYCDANADFVLDYNGGDGAVKQRYFVGWNPRTKEIVVARQGSDLRHFVTFVYIADFLPAKLNAEARKTFSRLPETARLAYPQIRVGPLIHNVPSSLTGSRLADYALVNMGFQTAWSATYVEVKAQVQAQLAAHPDAVRVFVTGHSLGATIAVLDGIALRNVVPTSVQVEVSVTGQPRVGNPVFAALLDQLVATPSENFVYHRITNHADVFPHLFPMITGYQHSTNEIWIPTAGSTPATDALLCPGRENKNCANSQVRNLNMFDHPGPYFGLFIGQNCR